MPVGRLAVEKFLKNRITAGKDNIPWSSHELADSLGVSRKKASSLIQQYKQASLSGLTYHVLFRQEGTRTNRAGWLFGSRVEHYRHLKRSTVDDIRVKVINLGTDCISMAKLNPETRDEAVQDYLATLDEIAEAISLQQHSIISEWVKLFEEDKV